MIKQHNHITVNWHSVLCLRESDKITHHLPSTSIPILFDAFHSCVSYSLIISYNFCVQSRIK